MQLVARVRVDVAGTDGEAVCAPRGGLRAAVTVHVPLICTADRSSTAFVTLNVQAHDYFGLPELTRAEPAAAHERTSTLRARSRV